jgi:hypothetical protein
VIPGFQQKINSVFGEDQTEKGYLKDPQLAQHSCRQEPLPYAAHTSNPGMKQYECGCTQPLLCLGCDQRETSGGNLKG